MSLILEALRKSEAERRRGVAPDVAMELPPTPTTHARSAPAWLPPVLVVGALAVGAALWWSQREPTSAVAAMAPAGEPAKPAAAAPAVVARTPPQPVAPQPAIAAPPPPPPTATADPRPQPMPPPPSVPAPAQGIANIDDTALPSVKLSMHMWDESPARRFVILDGQRMGEGDRNSELVVVAIERDGVIVERNGQRARVPLP